MMRIGPTFLLLILSITPLSAQPEARPDRLHPSYQHDRWDTQPKDLIHRFRAYTSSFDSDDDNDGDGRSDVWGVPEWVSYEMRAGTDYPEYEPRPSTWHTDRELYQAGIAPRDQSYVNTDYDRGHLCMRQHARRLGQNADWNSHSVLNAVPQEHPFNAGHWLSLEKLCAIYANTYDSVWIICGPIMQAGGGRHRPYDWIPHTGEELKIAVPHRFFKIIVKESSTARRPDVLAFIYDNDPALDDSSLNADHTPFLRSVREIENLTGLDFFNVLPRADQNAIETVTASDLWPIETYEDGNRTFALSEKSADDGTVRLSAAAISALYDEELTVLAAVSHAGSPSCAPQCFSKRQWRKFCRRCRCASR